VPPVTHTHALFAAQSQSIPNNLVASGHILGAERAICGGDYFPSEAVRRHGSAAVLALPFLTRARAAGRFPSAADGVEPMRFCFHLFALDLAIAAPLLLVSEVTAPAQNSARRFKHCRF
jgi:hypothetical protein